MSQIQVHRRMSADGTVISSASSVPQNTKKGQSADLRAILGADSHDNLLRN